mmetsp:Transcript_776/g.2099  ORF Transcript_776/g.2099 Transcript_776/m.2099 type:complete len:111 (-) Transcript_776:1864-2196(-)
MEKRRGGGVEGRLPQFRMAQRAAEDLPMDVYSLMSLFCGTLVFFLQIRMYAWLSLLFFFASIASTKPSESDPKQLLASAMLVLMVFFSAYIQPALVASGFFKPHITQPRA